MIYFQNLINGIQNIKTVFPYLKQFILNLIIIQKITQQILLKLNHSQYFLAQQQNLLPPILPTLINLNNLLHKHLDRTNLCPLFMTDL